MNDKNSKTRGKKQKQDSINNKIGEFFRFVFCIIYDGAKIKYVYIHFKHINKPFHPHTHENTLKDVA